MPAPIAAAGALVVAEGTKDALLFGAIVVTAVTLAYSTDPKFRADVDGAAQCVFDDARFLAMTAYGAATSMLARTEPTPTNSPDAQPDTLGGQPRTDSISPDSRGETTRGSSSSGGDWGGAGSSSPTDF